MGAWTNDGTIELLQPYFHNMQFQNTLDGWKQHSGNVALIYKSIKFANDESSRICNSGMLSAKYEDEQDDIPARDVGNWKKKTATLQRGLEKPLVAELLTLVRASQEIPNRRYKSNEYWDLLGQLTMKLETESATEKSTRLLNEMRTEEEQASVSFIGSKQRPLSKVPRADR